MGAGMAEYVAKDVPVKTIDEYNMYCHYVAGLVGHGLTRLFSASGLEDPNLDSPDGLRIANSMGLFLQKTNIIRDYLEDLQQGRTWWPQQIWSQYGPTLSHFRDHPYAPESRQCLNHLVADALEHVPDCLAYLSRLSDPQIFRFCAIPQVMAMATLAACYNNPNVFRKVCKIRKGLSAHLMISTNDVNAVHQIFYEQANTMLQQLPPKDANHKRTRELLESVRKQTVGTIPRHVLRGTSIVVWILFIFSALYLLNRFRQRNIENTFTGSAPMRPSADFAVGIIFCLALSYIFGFFGMNFF